MSTEQTESGEWTVDQDGDAFDIYSETGDWLAACRNKEQAQAICDAHNAALASLRAELKAKSDMLDDVISIAGTRHKTIESLRADKAWLRDELRWRMAQEIHRMAQAAARGISIDESNRRANDIIDAAMKEGK